MCQMCVGCSFFAWNLTIMIWGVLMPYYLMLRAVVIFPTAHQSPDLTAVKQLGPFSFSPCLGKTYSLYMDIRSVRRPWWNGSFFNRRLGYYEILYNLILSLIFNNFSIQSCWTLIRLKRLLFTVSPQQLWSSKTSKTPPKNGNVLPNRVKKQTPSLGYWP